jgi:hypothetical protein
MICRRSDSQLHRGRTYLRKHAGIHAVLTRICRSIFRNIKKIFYIKTFLACYVPDCETSYCQYHAADSTFLREIGDAEPHFQTGIAIQIGDAVDYFGDAGGNTLAMPGDAGGNTLRA